MGIPELDNPLLLSTEEALELSVLEDSALCQVLSMDRPSAREIPQSRIEAAMAHVAVCPLNHPEISGLPKDN